MAIRDGFIIPNASTYAPDYQTAQPDQGDFLLLGNGRFGVVSGCEVSLSGSVVTVGSGPNIVVIDGDVFSVSAGSLTVSGPGSSPRFDLVVVDGSNGLSVVSGVQAVNPVFPDITSSMVVLAAVFVPAEGGSTAVHLIDKRVFLQPSVIGVYDESSPIVRRYGASASSVKFEINNDGKILWNGTADAAIERTGPKTIKVSDTLEAANLVASSSLTLNGNQVVTDDQISWGNTYPESPDTGDIHVNTSTGDVYVRRPEQWSLVDTNVPVGTVIMSFAPAASMVGWLPLDGGIVARANAGGLWDMFVNWQLSETQQLRLPDMRGRFPLGADTTNPSSTYRGYRLSGVDSGGARVTLSTPNLPSHRHQEADDLSTALAGSHSHSSTLSPSSGEHSHTASLAGVHGHTVHDTGHSHGWDGDYGIVATGNGADTCLDIVFNDASHSHTTKPVVSTGSSASGISINLDTGHGHAVPSDGSQHTHTVIVGVHNGHSHGIPPHSSVGEGSPFVVQPPSLSLNFYIKK